MAGLLAGYLFTYLITVNYGANIFGLLSLCFSIFLFLGILGRIGVDINLVKQYAEEKNFSDKGLFYRVVLKSFILATVLSVLLIIFKDVLVIALFKKPELQPYIFWTALAIPFWTLTLVCAGLLRARKKNKWFAFLNIPGRFTMALIALLIFFLIEDAPIIVIKAHFYGVMFLGLLAFIRCILLLEGITFRSEVNSWKFLKGSIPMMLSSTILVVLGWMDTFVLGIYESGDQIGIYNVAIKIAGLASFTFLAINSILAPKLAEMYSGRNLNSFASLVRFSALLNGALSIVIVIGILVFHDWLLKIFGPEFSAGDTVLFILCFGQLITALTGSVGVILQMTGHQVIYQNIMIIALIVNVILNFVLIPLYGPVGAAIATISSIICWNVIGAIYIKVKLNISSYFNPFY